MVRRCGRWGSSVRGDGERGRRCISRDGSRVVTTVAGRSERTTRLAEAAGLELLRRSRRRRRGLRPRPLDRASGPGCRQRGRSCRGGAAHGRAPARVRLERGLARDRARARGDARRRGPGARRRLDLGRAAARRLPDARLSLGLPGAGAGGRRAAVARPPRRRRGDRTRVGREDVHRLDVQGVDRAPRARPPRRARARRPAAGARRPRRLVPEAGPARGAPARRVGDEGRAVRRRDARDRGDAGERGADAGALRGDGRGLRGARRDPLGAEAPEAIAAEPDLEQVLAGLARPAG